MCIWCKCTLENKEGWLARCYIHIKNNIRSGSESRRSWVQNIYRQIFIFPKLPSYLNQRKVNAGDTVCRNRTGISPNITPKLVCLKRWDAASRVQGNLRDMCVLEGQTRSMCPSQYAFSHLLKKTSEKKGKLWSLWSPEAIVHIWFILVSVLQLVFHGTLVGHCKASGMPLIFITNCVFTHYRKR